MPTTSLYPPVERRRRSETRWPTSAGVIDTTRRAAKWEDMFVRPQVERDLPPTAILGSNELAESRGYGEVVRPERSWDVTYVIAQPCVDVLDKACIEECPVDCIYEGKRMLYIHPDECVDCGACEPVCPVEAIYYEDDTPEQWKDYYKANVEFFDDLGSPGGASKVGPIDKDHPIVAALPPQAETS
jgi:NAD-dependent dihydropyrimidine dehydrogenase PreA subunit